MIPPICPSLSMPVCSSACIALLPVPFFIRQITVPTQRLLCARSLDQRCSVLLPHYSQLSFASTLLLFPVKILFCPCQRPLTNSFIRERLPPPSHHPGLSPPPPKLIDGPRGMQASYRSLSLAPFSTHCPSSRSSDFPHSFSAFWSIPSPLGAVAVFEPGPG